MGRKQHRTYTAEFKQQAAQLAEDIGTAKAARQLGIAVNNVRNWQKTQKSKSALSQEELQARLEEENRKLREENSELKKVNHILKAAAAFFSQDHLK